MKSTRDIVVSRDSLDHFQKTRPRSWYRYNVLRARQRFEYDDDIVAGKCGCVYIIWLMEEEGGESPTRYILEIGSHDLKSCEVKCQRNRYVKGLLNLIQELLNLIQNLIQSTSSQPERRIQVQGHGLVCLHENLKNLGVSVHSGGHPAPTHAPGGVHGHLRSLVRCASYPKVYSLF